MQTPDIRIALSHFLRQVEAGHIRTKTQRPKPLHYDHITGQVVEFSWCVESAVFPPSFSSLHFPNLLQT